MLRLRYNFGLVGLYIAFRGDLITVQFIRLIVASHVEAEPHLTHKSGLVQHGRKHTVRICQHDLSSDTVCIPPIGKV